MLFVYRAISSDSFSIMIFGHPEDFAIEAYHEPSGPKWGGCGRMCLHVQGVALGDIRENHCSLFHAVDICREMHSIIGTLWDSSFNGLSDAEIFAVVDHDYRVSETPDWKRYGRFYFLTFSGEIFDGFNIMTVCRPGQDVRVLYKLPDRTFGSASCSLNSFRHTVAAFVAWFVEQVRNVGPPYFPINPFNLDEKVPED